MEEGVALEAPAKALIYACEQIAIGVLVVRLLSPPASVTLERWLSRLAILVASLLVVGSLWRLWVHTAVAFGPTEAWTVENLRLIGLESRWGAGWQLQTLIAVGMVAAAVAWSWQRRAWILFAVGAVALGLAMPSLGHASGEPARHVLHAVHNLAAASWIGTLVVITLYTWTRHGPVDDTRDTLIVIVRRFSPLALSAAALVGASGSIAAWIYLGAWEALWTTSYGQQLAAKLGLVAIVVLCGWQNRRAVRGGRQPHLLLLTAESIAAALVVIVTAMLTETPHP